MKLCFFVSKKFTFIAMIVINNIHSSSFANYLTYEQSLKCNLIYFTSLIHTQFLYGKGKLNFMISIVRF